MQPAMPAALALLSAAFRLDAADVPTDSSTTCCYAMCGSMPLHWGVQQSRRETLTQYLG